MPRRHSLATVSALLLLTGCSCAPYQAQQNQRLQQEVQALRTENQSLRQALLRERRETLRRQLDERHTTLPPLQP